LIQNAGYKSESFTVATQDGYVLKVHRIKVKNEASTPRKGPVFFMHGLTATAADYLMTGPDIALRNYSSHFAILYLLVCLFFCSQLIFYQTTATMFGLEMLEELTTVVNTRT
jgi:Partial alpha/beta-hydrolase lipase region